MRHLASLPLTLSLCIAPAMLASGCRKPNPGPVETVADRPAPPAGKAGPNVLTPHEREEGWKLLFDGQSLAGWHKFGAGPGAPANWQVEDGTLAWAGKGGDIATDETFKDFELSLEWKISEGGNSGVMFHVTEDHKSPWETGPEMQILDDEKHSDGRNPKTAAAANYALNPAVGKTLAPVGEWNQARLVVKGGDVEHWLNGEKVVAYTLWSDDWKSQVAASKFAGMPDYGQRKEGHIVLQDHGDRVWFRNVKLRAL